MNSEKVEITIRKQKQKWIGYILKKRQDNLAEQGLQLNVAAKVIHEIEIRIKIRKITPGKK